jgi:PAS domain S-box-containing protein
MEDEIKHKSKEELINEIEHLQSKVAKTEAIEQVFNCYYDNIPAFVYIKDTDSNYIFINRHCENLFNVTREELLKRKYTDFDFFDVEMAKQLQENDKLVMQSGEAIETEEIGKPEGKQNVELKIGHRYYLALKFPLMDSEGKTIGVCGFSHDVTEKKQLEDEKEKLIKELRKALDEIRTLRGILPLCSFCKKIRNDKGYWEQVDVYIRKYSEADISHGICPECIKNHYPDEVEELSPDKNID